MIDTISRQDTIEILRRSLREPKPSKSESRFSHSGAKVTGKFKVFRVLRSNDIIFVKDHPRCDELDLRVVTLSGVGGKFSGRLRLIGEVEGTIRSGAPIYRMSEDCFGLSRMKPRGGGKNGK